MNTRISAFLLGQLTSTYVIPVKKWKTTQWWKKCLKHNFSRSCVVGCRRFFQVWHMYDKFEADVKCDASFYAITNLYWLIFTLEELLLRNPNWEKKNHQPPWTHTIAVIDKCKLPPPYVQSIFVCKSVRIFKSDIFKCVAPL